MYDLQSAKDELMFRVVSHLNVIYPGKEVEPIAKRLIDLMEYGDECIQPKPYTNLWDQSDVIVITYGDSIIDDQKDPLLVLKSFFDEHLKDSISTIHILPFFPYSSDDGFSVIDYANVNDALGDWNDICAISKDYKLMADLVINHCSARSRWFENFKNNISPGAGYFYEADPDADLSAVVRPRTSPLLKEVETVDGIKHVWCTFSHDQVDLNFENPEVLAEFVDIISHYIDMGVRVFRLDAIAFLWKTPGTPCINLEQTHEVVRLIRALVEFKNADIVIITETNIPNRENLSYFGNGNEAHWIYNFSLPPLLVHSLLSGDSQYLKQWMMSMPPPQMGTAFFNFVASHDGIGLRPAEGILPEEEVDKMVNTIQLFGGRISWRTLDNGKNKPYEMNVSLYDALQGTLNGQDRWQNQRFICAHAIMLALEGIPAFYIHSLFGTPNDYDRLTHTRHNRAINRHKWNLGELEEKLANDISHHKIVFNALKNLIAIRRKQPAFHPNATQFTLHLGSQIFAFWRQSLNRDQSIFAINNISDEQQTVSLSDLNLIETHQWLDLITRQDYSDLHSTIVLEPYQTVWLTNKIFI